MNMRAILGGALIGLLGALVLAIIVSVIDYQVSLGSQAVHVLIWVGAGLTSLTAGWAAGHLSDGSGWLHGILAAITLNLVASVVSETIHFGSPIQLWTGLGCALLAGLVGGVVGAASQY